MFNDYSALSNRQGFNKSLAHFRMVSAIIEPFSNGQNLADLVDELEKNRGMEKAQIGPLLNALVVERAQYATRSFNMPTDFKAFDPICEDTQNWNRLDVIVAYHHPQLGISLINPKRKSHWDAVQDFNRQELVVVYLKALREADEPLEEKALSALQSLLTGMPNGDTKAFHDPGLKAKPAPKPAPAAPAPAAAPASPASAAAAPSAPSAPARAPEPQPAAAAPAAAAPAKPSAAPAEGGKRRMTPKYSVQVTNELFHNGNVEAWKNIVESYKAKFPDLEVHIFHDGEKVNDINSLFKWGKVNHGDVLLFSVAGEDIKGVAKLQRYLFEGASLRFQTYLKKDVNKVLHLF